MFLKNSPGHITAEAYDAPDTFDNNFLFCCVRLKCVFVDFAGKTVLIGFFLINCILQLLYPVCSSEAETFKYIKIGEHETSTRIVKSAKLRYVKIGEHENYTRIVFEFKEPVRYNTPVIRPGGKIAIVFFDTTTALPRRVRVDATERVEEIAFGQQESNLNADVSMSFPRFRIKTFSLAEPDRLVIDVFRLENPVDIVPGNIVLRKMVFKDSRYDRVTKEAIQILTDRETVSDKDNADSPGIEESREAEEFPASANTTADTVDETEKDILNEVQIKYDSVPIAQNDQSEDNTAASHNEPDFIIDHTAGKEGGNDSLRVYLLPVLTALSGIIILLLVYLVFQKKKSVGLPDSVKRLDSLKANDENISAINEKIKREINKINQA